MENPWNHITVKRVLLGIITLVLLGSTACSDEDETNEPEKDCLYEFPAILEDFEGVWEPKTLIYPGDQDTIHYPEGMGHGGFMLGSFYYGDSYELRDNGEATFHYAENGRHCKDLPTGQWEVSRDSLLFTLGSRTTRVKIIGLQDNELTLADNINFKDAIITYRSAL